MFEETKEPLGLPNRSNRISLVNRLYTHISARDSAHHQLGILSLLLLLLPTADEKEEMSSRAKVRLDFCFSD